MPYEDNPVPWQMAHESRDPAVAVRRPIGYQVTHTYCRECAPESVRDLHRPMREVNDYGITFACDTCGADLAPCDHEWNEWHAWYAGGEFRSCTRPACEEIERR